MARLSDVQRQVLGAWWTGIEAEAYAGTNSTDTQIIVNAQAQLAGQRLSFAENTALATLFGYARRMANAQGELAAAAPEQTITSDMIAVPPWARDEQVMNTTPTWHVTFTFSYLDAAGNLQSDLRTSVQEMTMADTVGGLQDDVTADAQAMADKYNVTLQEASIHEILAV